MFAIMMGLIYVTVLSSAPIRHKMEVKGITTQVTFYSPDIVRIVKYPTDVQKNERKS